MWAGSRVGLLRSRVPEWGEYELEYRAGAGGALDHDVPPPLAHEVESQKEAQTGPALPDADEGFKDPTQVLGWNTAAVVGNSDMH